MGRFFIGSLFSCVRKEASLSADIPEAVTYVQHIAPIIQKNCVSCHQTDGSAPFPLTSYQQVAKKVGVITYVTRTRYMPPWKPDQTYSSFIGEKWMSDDEIEQLQQWKTAGMPYGEGAVDNIAPAIISSEKNRLWI